MKQRVFRVLAVIVAFQVVMAVVAQILRRRIPSIGDETSDEIHIAAAGRGIEMASRARSFRGGSARAIMGGLRLDLSEAALAPEGASLAASAVMGGVELIAPPTWHVRVVSTREAFGGFKNNAEPTAPPDGAPRLDLDVSAILGGVRVTTR